MGRKCADVPMKQLYSALSILHAGVGVRGKPGGRNTVCPAVTTGPVIDSTQLNTGPSHKPLSPARMADCGKTNVRLCFGLLMRVGDLRLDT